MHDDKDAVATNDDRGAIIQFLTEHPFIFRIIAFVGVMAAVFLIVDPYLNKPESRAAADGAAAQALGAALAAVALLVATWAVIVTKDIAIKIEISGHNDDLIAANTQIQNQWQALNLEFIRNSKLRRLQEPGEPTPDGIINFEERLAVFFYIMQIMKQNMLYESMGIELNFSKASRGHWSLWLTENEKDIWDWVNQRGRGFSIADRERVLSWAAKQKAADQTKIGD